jgi:hypothetical protein
MTESKYTHQITGITYPSDLGQAKIDKVEAFLKAEGITIAPQENSMGNPYLIISFEGSDFVALDETFGLEFKNEY